jgi:hypothetical protein
MTQSHVIQDLGKSLSQSTELTTGQIRLIYDNLQKRKINKNTYLSSRMEMVKHGFIKIPMLIKYLVD